MKPSTDFGTRPLDLEPHAGGDARSDVSVDTAGRRPADPGGTIEPVRLLAGGGSAFEQQLLGSARVDHMPAASRQQLARALNVPGVASPGASLRGLSRPSSLGKYGFLAGLGVFAVVAGWALQRQPARTPVEATRESVALVARPLAEAGDGVALASPSSEAALTPRVPIVADENPELAAPSPPLASSTARSRSRLRERSSPLAAGAARAGLRDELRALEAVQSSVRSGRSSDARRGLDDYARRFPRGELRLEAELLGLDVSLARGELKDARARARQLLARPDAARYRERLESLASAAGAELDATRLGSESPRSAHRTGGGY